MRARLPEILAFAEGVRADGFREVILLGMGGSSLCAEVLAETIGPRAGWPGLRILDSTDPEAITSLESSLELRRTLFIVGSKSGSTIETDCLARHFRARLDAMGVADAGRHFVAITDPGSPFVAFAAEQGWRAVFENPADIGGRYSATSLFGVVPAACMGIDVAALLDAAAREAASSGPGVAPDASPAVRLGALMGAASLAGCDKLTIRATPTLASFGAWAEQLIAESTGKEGRGVLPVVDEPSGCHAGRDRIYVDLVLRGDGEAAPSLAPEAHETITVDDVHGLGALFFRFEMATAMAGVVLGVNPFDEPNVSEAKAATNAVLSGGGEAPRLVSAASAKSGTASGTSAGAGFRVNVAPPASAHLKAGADAGTWLGEFLGAATPGDYVALLAYVAPTAGRRALLQEIRALASRRAKAATTLGWGPRYLHSTGQLHKGGAANGMFLLFTQDEEKAGDLAIPGKPFTFARLFSAQGEGDLRTLAARGRRVAEIRLARPVEESLVAVRDALRG